MANSTDIERLNYYEGEYLGALDFQAEQEYHRDMRRRHNLGAHTWGIVAGLDLLLNPTGAKTSDGKTVVDVYVQPGMAVDGFGREILVLSAAQLTQDRLAAFYNPTPANPPQYRPMLVWITYRQQLARPPRDACAGRSRTGALSFSRVQEGFELRVTSNQSEALSADDPLVIDGTDAVPPAEPAPPMLPAAAAAIPYDGSVPYQEFQENDDTVTWLVPLGRVMWDAHHQLFVADSPDAVAAGRLYAGSVAATVYAPAGHLTIQDRAAPSPLAAFPDQPGAAVEIAGSLSVDRVLTAWRDVWIAQPGKLCFKDANAQDGTIPIWVGRIDLSTGGTNLHVNVGAAAGAQALTVGTSSDGAKEPTAVLVVPMDGNVQIPTGSLGFGAQFRQQLNLWQADCGVGISPGALYFRSVSDFVWRTGGAHVPGAPDPGGQVVMQVDGARNLWVGASVVLDRANANAGASLPGLVFGGGSGEGIASNRVAGNRYGLDFFTNYTPRLTITNGGLIGIGTQTPSATLDVNGSINAKTQMSANSLVVIEAAHIVGLTTAGATAVTDLTATGTTTFKNDVGIVGNLSLNGNMAAQGNLAFQGNLSVQGTLAVMGSKSGYVVDHFIHRQAEPLERGDLVVLHLRPAAQQYYGLDRRIPLIEVRGADRACETRVCGIVDEPALDEARLQSMDLKVSGRAQVGLMVTLGAYAHCKVDADIAPVSPGDLLVTSPTRGHAQKWVGKSGHPPVGAVIAKALGGLKSGRGTIPVLVTHQ